MKAFTIVLGLFAVLALSGNVSAANNTPGCGDRRAVRCIGLEGSKDIDNKATKSALKKLPNKDTCLCENDKNHLYILAESMPTFVHTMEKCKRYAYRGLVCKDAHRA
ncbi:hypothetical protein BGZ68_010713 [Mortierella alpina]|nr:hypothetical protein BGZ68_010713 [Mortierella alpina]